MKTLIYALAAAITITAWSEVALARALKPTVLLGAFEAFFHVRGPLHFRESCYWNFPEDSAYVVPQPDDLERMFKYIAKYRWSAKYVINARDCDDAAREATYLAKRWGADFYKNAPVSVAFGSAYVRLSGQLPELRSDFDVVRGMHVLNFYLDSKRNVWFFEPQNGKRARVEGFVYEGVIEVVKLQW